jgi:hypothetical protein
VLQLLDKLLVRNRRFVATFCDGSQVPQVLKQLLILINWQHNRSSPSGIICNILSIHVIELPYFIPSVERGIMHLGERQG